MEERKRKKEEEIREREAEERNQRRDPTMALTSGSSPKHNALMNVRKLFRKNADVFAVFFISLKFCPVKEEICPMQVRLLADSAKNLGLRLPTRILTVI